MNALAVMMLTADDDVRGQVVNQRYENSVKRDAKTELETC
jgi:hypothetical protein